MKENGVGFTPFIFSLRIRIQRCTSNTGLSWPWNESAVQAFNGAPNLKMDAKASVFGDKESYVAIICSTKTGKKPKKKDGVMNCETHPV